MTFSGPYTVIKVTDKTAVIKKINGRQSKVSVDRLIPYNDASFFKKGETSEEKLFYEELPELRNEILTRSKKKKFRQEQPQQNVINLIKETELIKLQQEVRKLNTLINNLISGEINNIETAPDPISFKNKLLQVTRQIQTGQPTTQEDLHWYYSIKPEDRNYYMTGDPWVEPNFFPYIQVPSSYNETPVTTAPTVPPRSKPTAPTVPTRTRTIPPPLPPRRNPSLPKPLNKSPIVSLPSSDSPASSFGELITPSALFSPRTTAKFFFPHRPTTPAAEKIVKSGLFQKNTIIFSDESDDDEDITITGPQRNPSTSSTEEAQHQLNKATLKNFTSLADQLQVAWSNKVATRNESRARRAATENISSWPPPPTNTNYSSSSWQSQPPKHK